MLGLWGDRAGLALRALGFWSVEDWVLGLLSHAVPYRWALSAPGAVFSSVTGRAPGPRRSRGPWRPCSSILPLLSLQKTGSGVSPRVRGRSFSSQRAAPIHGQPRAFPVPSPGWALTLGPSQLPAGA